MGLVQIDPNNVDFFWMSTAFEVYWSMMKYAWSTPTPPGWKGSADLWPRCATSRDDVWVPSCGCFTKISCLRWSFFFQYTIGVTPYLWYFWDGEIALLFVGIDHEKMAFCELDENTSCNQPLFSQFLGCTPCSNLHHFPDENGHFWGILDILHVWTKPYSEQRAAVCTNCNWKIRSRFPHELPIKISSSFDGCWGFESRPWMQKRRQKPRKMLVTVYYNGMYIYVYGVFFFF